MRDRNGDKKVVDRNGNRNDRQSERSTVERQTKKASIASPKPQLLLARQSHKRTIEMIANDF